MPITLVCHGHAALGLDIGGARLLVDPFFSDNPSSDTDPADLPADFILVSHGHGDHVGDTVDIAKRTGATVITNFELASWFGAQGVSSVHAQHLGGGYHHPFGYLKLTLALHGSGLPDGSCGGSPCGFLLEAEKKTLYLACDTGLFGDMVIPVHYNTWDLIAQDAYEWKRAVEATTDTRVFPLSPGESLLIE